MSFTELTMAIVHLPWAPAPHPARPAQPGRRAV
jgi:hypothetical protein